VYGKIGIKVWIFKGELYGKRDLTPSATAAPSNDRGGRGGDDRRDRRGGNQQGDDKGADRRKRNKRKK